MSTKVTPVDAPASLASLLAPLQSERSKILEWLEPAQKREKELREQIVNFIEAAGITLKEGVNKINVPGLGQFEVDQKINRKLDEAALESVMAKMPEEWRNLGALINYKPTLVLSGLRRLDAPTFAVFAECLTETPGMPQLEFTDAPEATQPDSAPAVPDWPARPANTGGMKPGAEPEEAPLKLESEPATEQARKPAKSTKQKKGKK